MALKSPGVLTRENDQSTYVPGVNTTVGAYCGVFRWGPLEEIVTVSNEGQLVSRFGKPDTNTAASFFTASRFLSYSDALRLVRAAGESNEDVQLTVSTKVNDDMSDDLSTLVGSGFLSSSPRVRPGSIVTRGADSRTVLGVTDTELRLDSALPSSLSSASVTVTIYTGALNATAEEGTGTDSPGIGVLVKNLAHYEANYANGLANVGLFAARCPGALGNSLEVSICPSEAAFKSTLTGTVSAPKGSTTLTGNGTDFRSALIPGSIVKDAATGQERQVVSVHASLEQITIDKPFKEALSGATIIARWEFADAFSGAPKTSDFAKKKNASNDELHVVVVDRGGQFTGIPGSILERFGLVSKASDCKDEDGTNNYYVEKINRTSSYVYWMDHLPAGVNWGSEAAFTNFTEVAKPYTRRLTGGKDVNTGDAVTGARQRGYDLFLDTESVDIAILLGGDADVETAVKVLAVAETRQDCVAVLSPRYDDVINAPNREAENVLRFRDDLPSTSYGILSCNWLYVYDKFRDTFVWVPDNGDLGGIIARSDVNTYPWISPAGYNRGILKTVVKLAWNPTKAARDDLYARGINFVISQTGSGPVWLGDKTLLDRPSAFDRINVRRLFITIRKALAISARSLLHEINDNTTQTIFRNQTDSYLRDVQAKRGIYDFKVVCDSTNNTDEVVDRNEFVGDIYIQPAKSINFITLTFTATRSGVDFSELVGSA